jgi:hypothetical protein
MGKLNLTNESFNRDHDNSIYLTKFNSKNDNPCTSQNLLKIFHQNIRGFRSKLDELFNSLYPDLPHIICSTKHHLKDGEINSFVMENYTLGASFCRRSAMRGGTCIFALNYLRVLPFLFRPTCWATLVTELLFCHCSLSFILDAPFFSFSDYLAARFLLFYYYCFFCNLLKILKESN